MLSAPVYFGRELEEFMAKAGPFVSLPQVVGNLVCNLEVASAGQTYVVVEGKQLVVGGLFQCDVLRGLRSSQRLVLTYDAATLRACTWRFVKNQVRRLNGGDKETELTRRLYLNWMSFASVPIPFAYTLFSGSFISSGT